MTLITKGVPLSIRSTPVNDLPGNTTGKANLSKGRTRLYTSSLAMTCTEIIVVH